MWQDFLRPRLSMLSLIVAAVALTACTDSRTATSPGELFHCVSDGDCLSGWTCQCGYCQEPAAPQFNCGVTAGDTADDATLTGDASTDSDVASGSDAATSEVTTDVNDGDVANGDTGGPPVGTQIGICNQAVSSDVIFVACNLADWTGCSAGFGCYYGPAIKQTLCKKHTSVTEGTACDPCSLTECGLSTDNHPLICDAVDKICRRTCDLTKPVKPGQCPSGQQCYQLVDDKNVPYPSSGGVCAP